MVCTSCKTSYNVVSDSFTIIWWLDRFVGGGPLIFEGVVQKREPLDKDLQSLASNW